MSKPPTRGRTAVTPRTGTAESKGVAKDVPEELVPLLVESKPLGRETTHKRLQEIQLLLAADCIRVFAAVGIICVHLANASNDACRPTFAPLREELALDL